MKIWGGIIENITLQTTMCQSKQVGIQYNGEIMDNRESMENKEAVSEEEKTEKRSWRKGENVDGNEESKE